MSENEVPAETQDDVPAPKYVLLKMADRPAYLMGQLMEEGRDDVVLYYPVLVTVYNDEEGMSVVSSKYLPFAKDDLVSIVKTSIHAIATPKQKFIQHYLEFIKRWRDEGLERLLEARMLGERDPVIAPRDKTLNEDPPAEGEMKH